MRDIQLVDQCTEPLNMGVALFGPISSVSGSPTFFFTQPLIHSRVLASAAVLIGAEIFLFIAQRLFRLESVPIIDMKNGQILQMPLSELQGLLKWMSEGATQEFRGTIGNRGFITPQSLETPIIMALFVAADYSSKPYSPSAWFLFPIFTFPGIRGALPLLMLEVLATIFVRAVVPPESTGSKSVLEQDPNQSNNPLNLSPKDILELFTRFRKRGNLQ